ncbi:MAG: M1 family metallopeptidase [Gemmatimonadota bacterium]|nr:M1 family metallopeptidase [Gemmatimonadota bacterium]
MGRIHDLCRSALGLCALLALLGGAMPEELTAQNGDEVRRPVPAPVVVPAAYQRSLDRGWRSEDGSPGHSYWQQWSSYDLEARLDPETSELEGTVRILYVNNAPATLGTVSLHLHQNLYAEGSPRSSSEEITGGVRLMSVSADGDALEEGDLEDGPGYEVNGTLMQLRPGFPLEQGDTLELELEWQVEIPQNGSGRMGHSDKEMYFIAYWFPKIAVFDDLHLWDAQPYLGASEFYDGFGNYTAAISVPAGWTVMATGELQNPDEVLSALTLDRLAEAASSDELVMIAGQAERDAGTVTASGTDGWLTYRFAAEDVRDFTWTTSNVQQWDATSALVPDRDEDGEDDRVLIHAFWRPERAPLWVQQWEYGKQSIEHHSVYTGFPYPWSHMTSVEGTDIISGGMEFPMLTLIGPYEDGDVQALFNVTSHELAHMWIPMIVGSNEKRHAWMDEGSSTFLEDQSRMEIWPGVDHHRVEATNYLQVATAGLEQSMMRHADWYEPGPGGGAASYAKPATLMAALREVLGEETWEEAYRAFISEWAYKHPSPWDFFATFERFAEQDLDWFWTSFYFETWTLDHAVGSVRAHTSGGATVTIEDRGFAPFPVTVRLTTTRGGQIEERIPVEHWLDGNKSFEIEVPSSAGSVTRVEVDPVGYAPDVDRTNNFWPRGR